MMQDLSAAKVEMDFPLPTTLKPWRRNQKFTIDWSSVRDTMLETKEQADRFLEFDAKIIKPILEIMRRTAKPVHKKHEHSWITSEEENDFVHMDTVDTMPQFQRPFYGQREEPRERMVKEALELDDKDLDEAKKIEIVEKFNEGIRTVLGDMYIRQEELLAEDRPANGGE